MKTRLKALLQEKGITSKSLAEMMNLSEVSVSALVNGRSNNLETLAKAAQCIGVELWQLFVSFEDIANTLSNKPEKEPIPMDRGIVALCPHCGKPMAIKIEPTD